MMQDFYRVLKIHRTASQNEVKDAYRKLAMAVHPDRHNGCEKKAGEFKQATEAYTILSGELQYTVYFSLDMKL